jgi:hypothetical protein
MAVMIVVIIMIAILVTAKMKIAGPAMIVFGNGALSSLGSKAAVDSNTSQSSRWGIDRAQQSLDSYPSPLKLPGPRQKPAVTLDRKPTPPAGAHSRMPQIAPP